MEQAEDSSGAKVLGGVRAVVKRSIRCGSRAWLRLRELLDDPLRLRELLDDPLASYYLIVVITTLLLTFGVGLLVSTSSEAGLVASISPWSGQQHEHYLFGLLIGLPCMWLAAKCPPSWFRAAAYPLMFVSLLGLILAPVVQSAADSRGAARWLEVDRVRVQPSQLALLAFVLWGADLLARKKKLGQLDDWRQLVIPLLPGVGVMAMLVMLGDDLATTFVALVIFLALMWIIGASERLMMGMLMIVGLGLLILIVVEPYTLSRLIGYLSNLAGAHRENAEFKSAMGSGGWFGEVFGSSKQKLAPIARNANLTFMIIGEEFGLVGQLFVAILYGACAYTGLRIASRVSDTFLQLAATCGTVWIVTQAFINISGTLGLVPATSLPLPLVSYRLSSLLVTMVAFGMLISFAKREPKAVRALVGAHHRPILGILFRLGLLSR